MTQKNASHSLLPPRMGEEGECPHLTLSPRRRSTGGDSLEQGPPSNHFRPTPPLMASFPKSCQTSQDSALRILEGLTNSQGCSPMAPPRLPLQGLSPPSGATGHSESLWQTSGAAKAFSSFDHFINTCVLMPTTWERLPGNRSGNTLWGVFWLDGGDTRNRQGSMGRGSQAAGWPNLGHLWAFKDLWGF